MLASVVDISAIKVVKSKSDGSGFKGTNTVSPGNNLFVLPLKILALSISPFALLTYALFSNYKACSLQLEL